MKLLIAVSLLCLCGLAQSAEFSVTLDPQENCDVSWSFDNSESSSDVTFTLACATTGWVGLGISPTGSMTGADIVIGWVDSSGEGHIKDMHGTANSLPLVDDTQDVKLISSSETDGVTTITFKRLINTCDDEDNVIKSSTTRLIYAYGSADPADNVLASSDYHQTNRGVRSLYLLEPQRSQQSTLPDDALIFDIVLDNYNVPSSDTTYYCAFFDAPELDAKHHVIAVEPIVTAGNEALVHHILIYACWDVSLERIQNSNETAGECFTAEMPEFANSCRSVTFSWAIGGTTFYYPDNAGYPLGATDGSSPVYFMMEVHYDNPSQSGNFVDSSGLRIHYTPTLRDQDVGTVELGTVFGIAVPPNPEKFKAVAFCDSSCTNQWIPDEGVEVFAYMLHSHLLGIGITLEWYRNGKAMGIFAQDDAYDFNFQEGRIFPKNKKLLPGDTLKITCVYSDADRDEITYGGLRSVDEMCLAFLYYYPKQEIATCESYPGFSVNYEDKVYAELGLTPPPNNTLADLLSVLEEINDWSEEKVEILQKGYYEENHLSSCFRTSSNGYPNNFGSIEASSYPDIEKDEEKKPEHCIVSSGNMIQAFSACALLVAAMVVRML